MKIIVYFVCVVAIAVADPNKWQSFKISHNKTYKSMIEERLRYKIFQNNLKNIDEHNVKYEKGLVTFKKGINKFADMTNDEFLAFLKLHGAAQEAPSTKVHKSVKDIPTETDWRDSGAVTPVKDQGNCGSCWAFSATGSLEGQQKIIKGKLIPLSEQNLVDCADMSYGNDGCDGGLMNNAFRYVIENGINSEEDYPYRAFDFTCHFNPNAVVLNATGYVKIPEDDEEALINAVGSIGPVSVAIEATIELQFYESGLFDDRCSKYELNHGVLAVGYGSDNIIVKNSWGENWGENGYVRFVRGKNLCGIASRASYPEL